MAFVIEDDDEQQSGRFVIEDDLVADSNKGKKEPSFLDQLKKGTVVERYKAGTILYPEEETAIRQTLQGAASGPLMGAVQAGASALGFNDVAEKIAKNQREGNLLGALMQPEAWLSGAALAKISPLLTLWKNAAVTSGLSGLYGLLSATPEAENQAGQRAVSGGIGLGVGGTLPVASAALRHTFGGIVDTIGAALEKPKYIERLSSDAAKRLAGQDQAFIENAIRARSQFVPGANPTVAEAIAEQNMGQAFQKGGSTVRMQKTLSGAVGVEDVIPSATKSQQAAIDAYTEGVEKTLAPIRDSLLKIANKKGVDTSPIINRLNTMMQTPGDREAEMVKAVLPRLVSKLENMKQSAQNIVDARDVYAMRKNLAKTIKEFSKESGTWDKKLGSKLVREIQIDIDAAIDSAVGNNMWSKAYMAPYADKMAAVRAHEARMEAVKDIAKQVKSAGKVSVTTGDVPQIPNVLSRPITVINYGLKKVLGDANTPVAKELARRMVDPDEYAKLLALPRGNPTRELVERILSVTSGEAAMEVAEQ